MFFSSKIWSDARNNMYYSGGDLPFVAVDQLSIYGTWERYRKDRKPSKYLTTGVI